MMANHPSFTIDDLFQYLGYTGSFQDRERAFLTDAGYADWDAFLTAKGYTAGDLAARQAEWFKDNLFVMTARRNKGFSFVGQNVDMSITIP